MAASRKDYEAVARIIVTRRWGATKAAEDVLDVISRDLARHYAHLNDRFDSERFLKACGVQS